MANYEDMSLFDCFESMEDIKPPFKPLKLLSLFSGIGAFEKALDRIATPYDLVAFCEIDEHAARSYCAIHGVEASQNLGDITKVDEKALPKDIDVVTYGFPCQDISLAGNQKGLFNADGTKTRSGLFFDALRIIEETKPKVAIAENVKNLTGKKFRQQFTIVLDSLTDAGYTNYYAVLNAKHFGVPQNRERVFIVSIRNDLDSGFFTFPKGFPLERRLQDLLEPEVDEKYYLSDKMMEYLQIASDANKERGNGNQYSPANVDGVSKAITTKEGQRVKDNFIEEPAVRIREAFACGFADAHEGDSINLENPNSATRRGRVGHGVAQTLTTQPQQAVCIGGVGEKQSNGGRQFYQQDRVYAGEVALAHPANLPGGSYMYAFDEQNGYIRTDGCVGTITTDGSSPKHNNRIIETVGVWDGFNGRVRADSSVVGTLTQNCGADLKRNGQGIIEMEAVNPEKDGTCRTIKSQYHKTSKANFERSSDYGATGVMEKYYLSEKGVKFVCDPKRVMCTDVNGEVAMPLTAKGQQNWTGTFVSPDIDHLEKSTTIGASEPVTIHLKDGNAITSNDDVSALRIRKLTPKECFRLMGFDDADFAKAEAVNSNTQLYKQAGNSIVVDVLEHLWRKIIDSGVFDGRA